MKADEIRKAMNASPFHKFTLHLANGRSLKVEHRDFISVDPQGRTTIVFKLDGNWEAVGIPLVSSIEYHTGRNGRRRKAG
ncbi:MAG: hypothetical protein ICCCNLDF_02266 [Planctomycetes bacterium]|nr:hypothetical protein [Planctomycetota bacterium]